MKNQMKKLFAILLLSSTLHAKLCDLCDRSSSKIEQNMWGFFHTITFSKNNNFVLVGGFDRITSYRIDNNTISTEPTSTIAIPGGYYNVSTLLSLNSKLIITLNLDLQGEGTTELYSFDQETGIIGTTPKQTLNVTLGFDTLDWRKRISISADGKFLAVAGSHSKHLVSIYRFNEKGGIIDNKPFQELHTQERCPIAIQFSHQDCYLAITLESNIDSNGEVAIFRFNPTTESFDETQTPVSTEGNSPYALGFSISHTPFLTVANHGSNTIAVFNFDQLNGTLKFKEHLKHTKNPVNLSYSPNGECLAVGSLLYTNENPMGTIDLYRLDSSSPKFAQSIAIESEDAQAPMDVAYSPSGQHLATVVINFLNLIPAYATLYNTTCINT